MKCLICGTANLSPLEDEMDMEIDDVLGVCADCVADAALGRAVRSMTAWMFLYQNSIGWFCGTEKSHGTREYGERHDTPEAALKAAGLMEGEGK